MKKMFCLLFVVCSVSLAAQTGIYQEGSVVKMHMGDCVTAHHGFMVAFGGPTGAPTGETCPEYTLLSNKVVYVIVGRNSNQLIPLAESVDFRMHNDELLVRVDDSKREARFSIKEMIVRSEWDRMQRHIEEMASAAESRTSVGTMNEQ